MVELIAYVAGTPETVAQIDMEDGRVVIKTNYPGIRDMLSSGITGRYGQKYTLADKQLFIEELPYAFQGSRMRAIVV